MRWSPGCNCCGDSTVETACCRTLSGGFTHYLKLPASSKLIPSDPPCTVPDSPPWPYFGNLIVEVNGYKSIPHPETCNGNGSYSIRNGPGLGAGICQWSDTLPFQDQTGCSPPRSAQIIVTVQPGSVEARFYGVPFSRSFGTGDVPDFTVPYEIPYSGIGGFGTDQWDYVNNVPLVVYFP